MPQSTNTLEPSGIDTSAIVKNTSCIDTRSAEDKYCSTENLNNVDIEGDDEEEWDDEVPKEGRGAKDQVVVGPTKANNTNIPSGIKVKPGTKK
ncbi:hypothetical protein AGABI1DRAFT_112244 [Agaricus bisporus var. burnettii JB137-S8]|uniref:Uncharacterized protein n=1 Tax=Agaricus bisporus var. burnettii (strain JB137-S8 / ATCC MYA-4627 / FGSC 10392) TaxID=597362 RepID=K5W5P9_AGABU|nr:uncharacterized protein AGABI1DRAFT_112244 [Agaricus bisporus var. burnettii JB137-S8]EKM82124.1 hypothetical protein AGABI1DRAFT_112244 [Agaricus bisporus var. burnettii JB137-S8]